MPRFRIDDLLPLTAPADPEQLKRWCMEAEQAPNVLKALLQRDDILIHASSPDFLIVGVLALRENVARPNWDDLEGGTMPHPRPGWSIQHVLSGRDQRSIYLEPPLGSGTSKAFRGGEPLVFIRRLEAVREAPRSTEISQKFVHALDIHYLAERKAYCRIDSAGDIQDVVRIFEQQTRSRARPTLAITVRREDLEEYMALTGTSLVLRFDFTRNRGGFAGWGNELNNFRRQFDDMAYHGGKGGGTSYVNGALIVPGTKCIDDLVEEWRLRDDPGARQYAEFKIFDWKNGKPVETSCAPGSLSNYFQKSDLPFELSPAVFRAEVLQKYKADPEKYDLDARSISCRGAWHLETYDINEEGLVHTYIGYLSRLPYDEQLYWRSFNVWPEKGVGLRDVVSTRAFHTDFEGSWNTIYDPVESIERTVRTWNDLAPSWWQPRADELLDAVHHPATDSIKEWADELIALDQLLVEGFRERKLRQLAGETGTELDERWRSLKILEALVGRSLRQEHAAAAMSGLFVLHDLRSIVKGHATGTKREEAVREARTRYGSLRAHFRDLAEKCDTALRAIESVLLPPVESTDSKYEKPEADG